MDSPSPLPEVSSPANGSPPPLPEQAEPVPVPVLPYLTPMVATPLGVWREGKVLVAAKETRLPPACVKCNGPSDGRPIRKKFWWHHPAWLLLIFVPYGLILCVIIVLIIRKSGIVYYELCPGHRRDRVVRAAAGTALAVGGVVALLFGGVHSDGVWIGAGIFAFIGGLVLVVLSQVMRAKRIDDHYVWLRGAGAEFLAQFPVAHKA